MFEKFQVPANLIPSDPRFGSGPSLIPLKYVENLLKTGTHLLGTSHRKSPIKNLVKEIQEGLVKYFNLPEGHHVVLGNGGATFLFDMITLGMVEKSSAHFMCGEFSSKWFNSAKLFPEIEAKGFEAPFGEGIDATNVSGVDLIAMTLNETSTGVQMTNFPKVNDNVLLAVDATSGAGQVPCDPGKADIFFFSPQKVFASDGGLFVAFLSEKAIERSKKIANTKRYIPEIMNWSYAIDNSSKNQTYNTPAIATLFFLNEQIKTMNELGYEKVVEMSNKKAALIYDWAEQKEYLTPYIKDKNYRSNSVATIDVDDKYPVDDLIKILEKSNIVLGIDGYRKLGRNQFRISLFHNITYEDLEKLTKIISLAIEG